MVSEETLHQTRSGDAKEETDLKFSLQILFSGKFENKNLILVLEDYLLGAVTGGGFLNSHQRLHQIVSEGVRIWMF